MGAAQAAGSGAEDQTRFLKALEKYSIYQPTPVSIQHFIKFAQNSNGESSFAFLKHELPVRLANIMKELQLLPKQLHETHACKVSKKNPEKSVKLLKNHSELRNKGIDLKSNEKIGENQYGIRIKK